MEGYVGSWDSCLKDNLRQSSQSDHVNVACLHVCAEEDAVWKWSPVLFWDQFTQLYVMNTVHT